MRKLGEQLGFSAEHRFGCSRPERRTMLVDSPDIRSWKSALRMGVQLEVEAVSRPSRSRRRDTYTFAEYKALFPEAEARGRYWRIRVDMTVMLILPAGMRALSGANPLHA